MSAPMEGDEQLMIILDVGPGLCQLPRTPCRNCPKSPRGTRNAVPRRLSRPPKGRVSEIFRLVQTVSRRSSRDTSRVGTGSALAELAPLTYAAFTETSLQIGIRRVWVGLGKAASQGQLTNLDALRIMGRPALSDSPPHGRDHLRGLRRPPTRPLVGHGEVELPGHAVVVGYLPGRLHEVRAEETCGEAL